ncbi:MAG: hypothetical protein Q4F65_00650 [Propionibacteriaceae bacterium]|nr:hypothetical protein [Propionibacteriaceae bacterium]
MICPPPGRRRPRWAAVGAGLALALPLALSPVVAVPPPAVAATTAQADITLTDATITNSRLTLTGTLTNSGTEPLDDLRVDLWRSSALLRSAAAVHGALTAKTTTPGTARVDEESQRATLTPDDTALAPGESRPFTVSGTLAGLGLTQTDATWWVGVDAIGRGTDRTQRVVGSARTLASHPEGTLPVAEVVEFSAEPRQVKQDLFVDETLATEITTGRLDALMDHAEARRTDWVLDPSLLLELTDMADGYRVLADDGSNTAGTGAEAAAAWLARLDALQGEGASGLFGSPDVPALADLDATTVLDAVRAASESSDADDRPGVALVDGVDAETIRSVAPFGRPIIAIADEAAERAGDTTLRVDAGGSPALVAAADHPAAMTSDLLPDTPLNRRAVRFAFARAAGGELRWVRTPTAAPPDDALPIGFRRVGLPALLAASETPSTPPPAPEPDPEPAPSPDAPSPAPESSAVTSDLLGRVERLRTALSTYADAAPGSGLDAAVAPQTARAASRWWVANPTGLDAWLTSQEVRASAGEDFVSLEASPRFSMTGDVSEFPVTVTNHLVDPVTVRVAVVGDNPQRIRLSGPESVEIAPGASNTVLLSAASAGGGVVRARVHVETLSGHRLTPDREIVVETTNVGIIGWVLVGVSGVVLVATTAHRIRQVRKHGKGEHA